MELVLGKGHPLVCPWQIFPQTEQSWVLGSRSSLWGAAGVVLGGFMSLTSCYNSTENSATGCSSALQGGESSQPLEWKSGASEVPKWMRSWCPSSWGGWRQWWSSWGFLGTWSGLENPKLFGKLLKISILCLPPWSLLWPLLCSAKRMVRA